MIKTSLEWAALETTLIHKSTNYTHGREIRRMIRNISFEVAELSRAEVLARRGKKMKAEEILAKVNQDIQTVQEFLLVAALIG